MGKARERYTVDSGHPDVTVEEIDPIKAKEYLNNNTHNRRLRTRNIVRFADDMRRGDWKWTGEPIQFSKTGVLLNGQNRLSALIEAGVTLPFVVVRGLEDQAQDDMDTGAPRSFSDVLTLRGESSAHGLSALVRRVAAWQAGERRGVAKPAEPLTHSLLLRTLEAHPELREVQQHAHRVASRVPGIAASSVGLLWWLCDQLDPDDALFFFDRLADGQGLVKGDPIFELRRWLADNAAKNNSINDTAYVLGVAIKAWNAYRDGRSVAAFKFRIGGAKPETFPEPK